ncbi:hypothetical protein T12_15914 [Trichinella patagoniensis]|uniref:Uncharacterized protein n=1 Tax=Trichinella patagoniensis TaxID=990121 RepID=A0A0V0Z0D8_9BILA|nr:hypothetical protein T12_15914 [Trichinella patagoniensis]
MNNINLQPLNFNEYIEFLNRRFNLSVSNLCKLMLSGCNFVASFHKPKSILILLKAEGVSTNLCLAKLVIWDRMPFRFLAKAQKFKKDGLLEDFQLLRLKRNERYGYVVW